MPLFQTSVLKKYLSTQDKPTITKAFWTFYDYFANETIQQNIRESKEEQFQEGFLRELFVKVLGYTLNPNPDYNLTTEFKNQKGAKKADGAMLQDGKALGVIELKSTKTKDLEDIRQQAFDYKANQSHCQYVITSNFEKLRFYVQNAVDFEEFDLFKLTPERFEVLWLCLSANSLFQGIPLKVKQDSLLKEENITKQLYKDYTQFKSDLFADLVQNNLDRIIDKGSRPLAEKQVRPLAEKQVRPLAEKQVRPLAEKQVRPLAEKEAKLLLFQKSQKLLDRFLFIFFAEDRGLLPPNSINQIVAQWEKLKELDEYKPLYDRYKKYFTYLNEGHKGKNHEIYAYNGGLFKPDEWLDTLVISDDVLHRHTIKLTAYDFETEVDVNILGHIFENSLNEIEEVTAQIEGSDFDQKKTKRKKDGVFYTPKYITKYIVDNTLGRLCEEKKTELDILEEEYFKGRKGRKKETLKTLVDKLETYREWLLSLTVCDPACGSGAFLNQALDFLIAEHGYLDELHTKLLGGSIVFPNVENTILERNIYGVDINEEATEIAKLSLWLRTAQKGRKLTTLSSNIKSGNSLIADPAVAGELAFNWEKEFPEVFRPKEKQAFHVTCVTHDSRTSQRMIDYKVRQKRYGGTQPQAQPFCMTPEEEVLVAERFAEEVQEKGLDILAYHSCVDHIHFVIVCEPERLEPIVGKLKEKTAKRIKEALGIPKEETFHLWGQKFNRVPIESEEQLWAAIDYVRNNRIKHGLPDLEDKGSDPNKDKGSRPLAEENPRPLAEEKLLAQLHRAVEGMVTTYDHAFRSEHTGGFDVIIGNPPYLRVQGLRTDFEKETVYFENKFKSATGRFDIYLLFIEHFFKKLNPMGEFSMILPHKFMVSDFGEGIRKFLSEEKAIASLVHFGAEMVFEEASTYTCILHLNQKEKSTFEYAKVSPHDVKNQFHFQEVDYSGIGSEKWSIRSKAEKSLFDKLFNAPLTIKDVFNSVSQGVVSVGDDIFFLEGEFKGNVFTGYSKKLNAEIEIEAVLMKPVLKGEDVKKYAPISAKNYVIYPHYDLEGKTVPYEEEEFAKLFPKAYAYFLNFKEELIEKKVRYKTNPKYWYSLHRSREMSIFETDKIITPEISLGSNFTYDSFSTYHNTKCYSLIPDEKYQSQLKFFLTVLNSKVLWLFLNSTGYVLRGGYFTFKTKYLEPFPLPEPPKNWAEYEERANKALALKTELDKAISGFLKLLSSKFEIEKFSKKLQNWHELEFKDFLNELKKASSKQGVATPWLTLAEEAEWLTYFEEQKAKATALQTQITTLDREIDQLVYQL